MVRAIQGAHYGAAPLIRPPASRLLELGFAGRNPSPAHRDAPGLPSSGLTLPVGLPHKDRLPPRKTAAAAKTPRRSDASIFRELPDNPHRPSHQAAFRPPLKAVWDRGSCVPDGSTS